MEIFKDLKEFNLWKESLNPEIWKWEPEDDRVIIQRAKVGEKVTKAGIILPKDVQEKPNIGRVILIGPEVFQVDDRERQEIRFQIGDVILFGKYSGADLTHLIEDTEHDYMIVRSSDIIAVKRR